MTDRPEFHMMDRDIQQEIMFLNTRGTPGWYNNMVWNTLMNRQEDRINKRNNSTEIDAWKTVKASSTNKEELDRLNAVKDYYEEERKRRQRSGPATEEERKAYSDKLKAFEEASEYTTTRGEIKEKFRLAWDNIMSDKALDTKIKNLEFDINEIKSGVNKSKEASDEALNKYRHELGREGEGQETTVGESAAIRRRKYRTSTLPAHPGGIEEESSFEQMAWAED